MIRSKWKMVLQFTEVTDYWKKALVDSWYLFLNALQSLFCFSLLRNLAALGSSTFPFKKSLTSTLKTWELITAFIYISAGCSQLHVVAVNSVSKSCQADFSFFCIFLHNYWCSTAAMHSVLVRDYYYLVFVISTSRTNKASDYINVSTTLVGSSSFETTP